MSYEREGLDPTNTELTEYDGMPVEHLVLQGVGVHIIDTEAVIAKAANERVQLVDNPIHSGFSGAIRVAGEVHPRRGQYPAHIYRGAVMLQRTGAGLVKFAEHVEYDDFGDVTITNYGKRPGSRIVSDATNAFQTAVVYDAQGKRIRIANDYRPWPGSEGPGQVLRAPLDHTVSDRRAQLVHFLNSLVIGAHIGNNIGHGTAFEPLQISDLVVTPDGPLYRNPDTDEFVHNLRRKVVVINRGKDDDDDTFRRPRKAEKASAELEVPNDRLSDLYGIEDIKATLAPIIAYYKHPEVMKQWNVDRPPAGILLKGPAGTGKTAIVRALAHEIGAGLRMVRPSDIMLRYIGEAEAATQKIFDSVRDVTTPTVLFFDEIDSTISSNNAGSDSGAYVQNAVAAIFKKETAEIAEANPNVLFAAATNFPERIHDGLIRAGRFDLHLTVSLPDEEARGQIMRNTIIQEIASKVAADAGELEADHAASTDTDETPVEAQTPGFPMFAEGILDDASITELARMTDGWTISDLKTLLRQTKMQKALSQIATGHASPISVSDLRQAAIAMRRT